MCLLRSGIAERLALSEDTKLTALRLERAEDCISTHSTLLTSVGGVEAARSSGDPELQAIGNEFARHQGFVSKLNSSAGSRKRHRWRGTKEEKKAKAAAYRELKQQRAVAQLESAAAVAQPELQLLPAPPHEEQPDSAKTISAVATNPGADKSTASKPGAPKPGADKQTAPKPGATNPGAAKLPPWPVRGTAGAAASAAAIGANIYPEVDKGLRHLTSGASRLAQNASHQARR